MNHLNFDVRASETRVRPRPFNPRASVSLPSAPALDLSSALWTAFAVMAVAAATVAIVCWLA